MTHPTDLTSRPDEINEWLPIHTAPRDGTVIDLTWLEDGRPQEIYPMGWQPAAENSLLPGVRGFWVLDGGGATWSEHHENGWPTHWRPRGAQ